MKRVLLLLAMILISAPAMAQVEALGVAGFGSHFDNDNTSTLAAFGGANIYLLKDSGLSVFSRTGYKWVNTGGEVNEFQGISTALISKKYFYRGFFAAIGGGASFEVEDKSDKTYFEILTEVGATLHGMDVFAGINVASVNTGKSKFLYLGVSLD